MPRWIVDRLRAEREHEANALAELRSLFPGDPWGASLYALDLGVSDKVPSLLYDLWCDGSIDDIGMAVHAAWVHNRAPARYLGERKWLALFRSAGVIVVREGGIGWSKGRAVEQPAAYSHLVEVPPEPFAVWRGALLDTKGRGMSWSAHLDCARDFAQGVADTHQQPTGLYRAVIPPKAVLALFGDMREQEVVVNPNMLSGRVELADEVQPTP